MSSAAATNQILRFDFIPALLQQVLFTQYSKHEAFSQTTSFLQEANAAMGLNGQMLGDRALKVENAKSARKDTPQGAANPYTAIQLQQMQQLQLAQMQSSTLAAQVNIITLDACMLQLVRLQLMCKHSQPKHCAFLPCSQLPQASVITKSTSLAVSDPTSQSMKSQ